ncbi:MAG: hypothetical protein JWM16_2229 [Verrucomicrobiales bacterium]|nr:hypothetical protein [Verrucomicrobiales bacterium]
MSLGTSAGSLTLSFSDGGLTTEHELRATGLTPNTAYYYAVGSSTAQLAGGVDYYFRTAPLASKPTRIWVIGDAGTQTFQQEQVRDAYYSYAQGRYTDLWLILGDNAYPAGTDDQYQAAVFNVYPEILRQTPVWPTIGNHETYGAPDNDHLAYLDIFTLPRNGEAGGISSGTEKYYSFNYGNIHFVCLDSMTVSRQPGSAMLTWLEQDLAANTNHWLIAYWHHPPYTKGSHDSDYEIELIEMRSNVLPVLESYGVDLVLSGHSHAYERSYLLNGHYGQSWEFQQSMKINAGSGREEDGGIYNKTVNGLSANKGAVYVVAGSSGQTGGGELNHPAMFLSLNELGSLVLDLDGSTLEAVFLRETGEISDHFTLHKSRPSDVLITHFAVGGGLAYIEWKSKPGSFYRIQYTTNLTPPQHWVEVSGNLQATGTTTPYYDFYSPTDSMRTYRVVDMTE